MTGSSVLIFDDDAMLASSWAAAFRQEGFRAEIALTRVEAEAWCSQREFDLIVCDIFIRDEEGNLLSDGGVTLVGRLRLGMSRDSMRWTRTVPILVVTGAVAKPGFDPAEIVEAMGANEVLRKPVEAEEVVRSALGLLGR